MTLDELRNQFPAAPEYLTQIFLIERDSGSVSNACLAERLKVSRPAVSQAIGRLKKLNLAKQDRYGVIRLTTEGRMVAGNVVRRHFLLEHLLVDVLDYPWDKSDVEAGKLQTSLSDELTEYIDVYLGRPQTCPHGNPLPGSSIEKHYLDAPSLADAEIGARVKIIRITEEGEMTEDMLPFCQLNHIAPNLIIDILEINKEAVLCKSNNHSLSIPSRFSKSIRWEPA